MRILHVVATVSPQYGGPAVSTVETCAALGRRGHEVELWATDWGPGVDGRPQQAGSRVENGYLLRVFERGRPRQWTRSPTLAAAARSRVQAFDVAEIHGIYHHHSMAVSLACQRAGVPYILRPYGSYDPYHRHHHALRKRIYETLVDNRNMRRAAFIRCTSEREQRGVAAVGFHRTVIVPLGVDLDPGTRRDRARDKDLNILFLSRISTKKNVPLLVSAFAELRRHPAGQAARLVLAGPAEEQLNKQIRALIVQHGLQEAVRLTGLIAGTEKSAALRKANTFVLPSDDESFGLAVLEAAAAGLAIVVSPDVAIGQSLSSHGAAVVSDKDVGALADSLVDLAQHPSRRDALGKAAARLASEQYGWDAVAERLEGVYLAALAHRGGSTV
jgi:glycosyltransferase involved in cell wall biosynthesis